MKLGIIGMGLMGGSVMLALEGSDIELVGYVRNDSLLNELKAKHPKVAFSNDPQDLIDTCDCIFICLNPSDELGFIKKYSENFREGTIISDISGVKGEICKEIRKLIPKGVAFVPAHPMAGRESSGFKMAAADLFCGCNFIICLYDGIDEQAVECIADLARKLNAGRIILSDIETHDATISYTSQLPHILALSYVNTMGDRDVLDFTAGSFHDVSRVANINSKMWTELFIRNKENLCNEIKNMEQNMRCLRELIEQEKFEELVKTMDRISKKLEEAK